MINKERPPFRPRPLDQSIIDRIVEAECSSSAIEIVDPTVSLGQLPWRWGREFNEMKERRAKLTNDERIARNLRESSLVIPCELVLAYAECVRRRPEQAECILDWTLLLKDPKFLYSRAEATLQDDYPDENYGIPGLMTLTGVSDSYRSYFSLKHADGGGRQLLIRAFYHLAEYPSAIIDGYDRYLSLVWNTAVGDRMA